MSTMSYGAVPPRPLDPGVLKGLYAERVGQAASWQTVTTIAPIQTVPQTSGEMPVDGTWRGLDLQADPSATAAKSLTGTDYTGVKVKLDTEAYELQRYMIGRYERSYLAAKRLQADNGVDEEAYVARIFADKAAGVHADKVFGALSATDNYATGYQVDGGNITDPTFSFISLAHAAASKLQESQAYEEGKPIDVIIGNDVITAFQKLNEVRNRSGVSNANYATPNELSDWLGAYLPGARLHFANAVYRNASGVPSRYLSGAICFSVPRESTMERGHIMTLGLDSVSDAMLDLRVQPNAAYAGGGEDVYADAYYKVHVEDINGAGSTSGYLAHSLLS